MKLNIFTNTIKSTISNNEWKILLKNKELFQKNIIDNNWLSYSKSYRFYKRLLDGIRYVKLTINR